jgi:hypothetical protein
MADSGTKLSLSKCKLNVLFQCVSSAAGTVFADQCDFVCSGIVLRGSSSCSSFDVTDSTFHLSTESSLGISSSHGHKTVIRGCQFVNGMCAIMIDSDALCNVTKSTFAGCKFCCRCRDSHLDLLRCSMYNCQKCLHSFGPKGNIKAFDCKFEKISLNCIECASESNIGLNRCAFNDTAICVIKSTTSSKVSINDSMFENCNTKVLVGTGGSVITITGSSFTSMSGNGFDFSDNVIVSMENVIFHVCSGIGIQLANSTLYLRSSQMSSILLHCILSKQNSTVHATDCTFEFFNGKMIVIENSSGELFDADPSNANHKVFLTNCQRL